jgi:hypothetical protein
VRVVGICVPDQELIFVKIVTSTGRKMQTSHSDSRRTLTSFPEGKMIVANQDAVIGKHWHALKVEIFLLSSGECKLFLVPETNDLRGRLPIFMQIGALYTIPRGQYHEFHLTKGSILIGLNSRVYDPSDDYRFESNAGALSDDYEKSDVDTVSEIKIAPAGCNGREMASDDDFGVPI